MPTTVYRIWEEDNCYTTRDLAVEAIRKRYSAPCIEIIVNTDKTKVVIDQFGNDPEIINIKACKLIDAV